MGVYEDEFDSIEDAVEALKGAIEERDGKFVVGGELRKAFTEAGANAFESKKYRLDPDGFRMDYNLLDPPIKEGGAVCATFFRDEEYAKRFARRINDNERKRYASPRRVRAQRRLFRRRVELDADGSGDVALFFDPA